MNGFSNVFTEVVLYQEINAKATGNSITTNNTDFSFFFIMTINNDFAGTSGMRVN